MGETQIVKEIVEAIRQFKPVTKEIVINTEEDLNLLLAYWIAGWLRKAKIRATIEIEHEFERLGEGSRVDILVKCPPSENIAIEVKIVKAIQDAKNLLGELQADKSHFDEVIGVIIETRKRYDYRWYEYHFRDYGMYGVVIKGEREKIEKKKGNRRIRKQKIILGPLKGRFIIKKDS